LLTQFTERYIGEIKGKSGQDVSQTLEKEVRLSTGSVIKAMFEDLYDEQSRKDYRVSADLREEDIERAIKNHQGDSIPGFPSIHAFLYLLSPRLQKLKEPALDLLHNVYTELRKISGELIAEVAKKAPGVMDEMMNEADRFLQQLKQRAEEVLLANIDSEINYIFTNDENYLENRTKLIPAVDRPAKGKKGGRDENAPLMDAGGKGGEKEKEKGEKVEKGEVFTAGTDTKDTREKLKKEAEKMFVRELRLRVDEYYRIVIRTLRVKAF
jgi:vacuolar protein sorting-associated protein 1